jgi:hypothetical protein
MRLEVVRMKYHAYRAQQKQQKAALAAKKSS